MFRFLIDELSGLDVLRGGLIIFFLFLLLFFLGIAIFTIIVFWKLLNKCGQPGWSILVPFYNNWTLCKAAGLNILWFILFVIFNVTTNFDNIIPKYASELITMYASLVNFIISFNIFYSIAIRFNKSKGFAICSGIFPVFVFPVIAFSRDSVYDENAPIGEHGIFGGKIINYNDNTNFSSTNNSSINESNEGIYCSSCGYKNNANAKFCVNCGNIINK